MWATKRGAAALFGTCLLLPACASTATQSQLKPSERPIPDALPIASNDVTNQVVIAQSENAVGASWTSVTDSQLGKTAAELSNIGGTPFVLGTVTAVIALDAKPRGRAARMTVGAAGEVLPEELDADLAERLQGALGEAEEVDAEVSVQPVKRLSDLPEDAWVVFTRYTLAEDGTALRATAEVGHTDDVRRLMQAERDARQQRYAYGTQSGYRVRSMAGRYDPEERNKLRRRKAPPPPRYKGTFVYHSDPFVLPDVGDIQDDDRRDEIETRIVAALDVERDARRAAADARYASDMERAGDKAGKQAKAERRRAKAYAKADSLHAKSMESARDGEIDKMERLVLGIAEWADDGTADEPSLLSETLLSAHEFFADAMAQRLPQIGTGEPVLDRELSHAEKLRGIALLEKHTDGRTVVEVIEGPQAGVVISMPEDGAAEYGKQTSKP